MIYGTAHDDLNGHGSGLGYAAPNPAYVTAPGGWHNNEPATIDIPLSCGIDPNGNSWVMFNNQYFSSFAAIQSFLNQWSNSGAAPFSASNPGASRGYAMLQDAVAYAGQLHQSGGANVQGPITIAEIVGRLKAVGVPFTAYQPPPPVNFSVVTPGAIVSQAGLIAPVAPDPATLISKYNDGMLAQKDFYYPKPFNYVALVNQKWSNNYYLRLYQKFQPDGTYWFSWNGQSWDYQPAWTEGSNPTRDTSIVWTVYFDMPLANLPVSAYDPPAGYKVLQEGAVFTYPLYGTVPVFNADGTTSFANAAPFYGLTRPDQLMGGMQASQYIGLDKTKFAAGLYAYKTTDLGPITSPAGRTYQLTMIAILDLTNKKIIGPFFQTTEGGGGGLLITNPVALASRIIVDVSTFGSAEAARAGARAAGVSQSTIDMATMAGAALAIAIATVGTGIVLSTPAEAAAVSAFPVAADAGSATASLFLPTTVEVAAMDAAGATLLPASLSLIAPAAIPLTVAEAVTAGAVATTAVPEAAVVTPSSIAVPAGVKTVAAGLTKAVQAAVVATGTTALSTEIKKLTGQLPGAKPPSQLITTQTVLPPANSASASKLLTWGLGALAALAIFKKHSS